ncbi:MAG TPA: dsRBD fold-containing protein [Propionibacteriaceae bacterium]|nr:dsRBD fold-containing protein [Propionibacteriaceae bacterium]
MNAEVGDRIVVASGTLHRPIRDGEILQIGADGGGPYLVRWSDSGNESLFFPGPDAHVEHVQRASGDTGEKQSPVSASGNQPTKTWRVDIYLYEDQAATSANAVLHSDVPAPVDVRGEARRSPADPDMPTVGDEVAAARALRQLADRLLEMASSDLSDAEGHPVSLSS